jgi:uroporphyrinogen-III synthase
MSNIQGQRILILREQEQGREMLDKLNALGAQAIAMPLIAFEANQEALKRITPSFLQGFTHLIFTSSNGVRFFIKALEGAKIDPQQVTQRIAAVGEKTAAALREFGLTAHLMPKEYRASEILALFPDRLEGIKILMPVASGASEELPKELQRRGAEVRMLKLYHTVPAKAFPATISKGDWVVFTSPSTVHHFFASGLHHREAIVPFCIGPVTKTALEKVFKGKIQLAKQATIDALISEMVAYSP